MLSAIYLFVALAVGVCFIEAPEDLLRQHSLSDRRVWLDFIRVHLHQRQSDSEEQGDDAMRQQERKQEPAVRTWRTALR